MAIDVNALKDRATSAVRSFTPQQLTVVALLGIVAIAGGFMFLRWVSAPSYSVLYSGLSEEDAADVVKELDSQGVGYKLDGGGTTVLVKENDVYDTRLALSSAGVPRGGSAGYELLDKQGFTTSEFRQRVDYQRAVEGELSRTLMALDGVEAATVHLAIPEESLFAEDEKPARASVLLRTERDLGEEQVQSVVNLVASAVPDLDPDNVTVADDGGNVLSVPGGGSLGGLNDSQLKMTRAYETQRAAEAETMLSRVYGPGHAVVRVSAQLDFDETSQESERFNPDSQTPLEEQTSRETFEGTGAPPQGVVGVEGQPLDAGGTNSNYEKEENTTRYGVDRTVTRSKDAPGKIERQSVAVVLDGSAQPVPDAGKVEDLVAAAIGLDARRGDSIVVDTVAFDASLADAAKEADSAAKGKESQQRLLGLVRTGVGALVLLLVAFFLWRGMKSTKEEPLELPESGPGSVAAALAAVQRPAGALGAAGGPAGLGGFGAIPGLAGSATQTLPTDVASMAPVLAGAGTADSVLSLIDQQPEEVAVLLRSWLADRRS